MYKVAEQLLYRKGPSALPKLDSLQILVTHFSQFFKTKITKIRKHLDVTATTFQIPTVSNISFTGSNLTQLDPTSVEEVNKGIKKSSKYYMYM